MFDRLRSILRALGAAPGLPATGSGGEAAPASGAGRGRAAPLGRLGTLQRALRAAPLIMEGKRLREAGRPREAARAFEAALERDPTRTNIKVQCGNMHKDCGELDAAFAFYDSALRDRPGDPDIHLQRGHALKLAGRRSEALSAYRTVLRLDPANRDAGWELIQAGEADAQEEGLRGQIVVHGLEATLSLVAEVGAMRRRLSDIAAQLPDIASLTAFPAQSYGLFRQIYDIPPPPPALPGAAPDFLIVADAAGLGAEALHRLVGSLLAQSSTRWRARLRNVDPDLAEAVARIARADGRIAVDGAEVGAAGEISATGEDAGCDAVLFVASGAALHRHCVAWFEAGLANTAADFLTCDEEWSLPGSREPFAFEARGGLDPDMLLHENSWGETIALRRAVLTRLGPELGGSSSAEFASALLLAAVRADAAVAHLPYPLVVFEGDREGREAARVAALAGHRRAVERHLERSGLAGRVTLSDKTTEGAGLGVTWLPKAEREAITVVVATRDNAADCEAFIDSLFGKAAVPALLFCRIVDNGTREPSERARLEALGRRAGVELLRDDGPFNWSHLNNVAAAGAETPILVFANDDMEMLSEGWDETLRGLLARGEVGAIGAKLLYPDATVQHAGILFGWKGSVIHDGLFEPADAPGPSGRWAKTRRVGAVTGAFLAVRRADFAALGGFEAVHLPVGYSDVDLCLRLRAEGLKVIFAPHLRLFHHESKSRGLDHLNAERHARSRAERAVVESRWGRSVFGLDPTVAPIWLDVTLPYRLIGLPSVHRALEFLDVTSCPDRAVRDARNLPGSL
ncbi:tetratricopeptide repeat protein [Jiella sonneratiae]|uniref:Glycosyltransferase n=1 Tax=Jiella sonneratiae TaxID=2816856 RepID=A0ABS3J5W9_9HYPH|nr:tetratricopeptide repeat protein [Jiella sonneratiae]MBO0905055.1 glycosyltransferase [Jiella sonneratiae]